MPRRRVFLTAPKALKEEGAVMAGRYTVDGETFFDTRAGLKANLEDVGSGINNSGDAFDEDEVCACV